MQLPSDFDYHYFDDPNADGYRGYPCKLLDDQAISLWDAIADFCVEHNVKSAIDIGCAKGFFVSALRIRGIETKGFDISEYALSFADRSSCFRHDLRDGVPGDADALIALGVLIYLAETEIRSALYEIRRATKKFFLFSAHYKESRQVVRDPLRLTTQSHEWWISKIESVGFALAKRERFFDVYV